MSVTKEGRVVKQKLLNGFVVLGTLRATRGGGYVNHRDSVAGAGLQDSDYFNTGYSNHKSMSLILALCGLFLLIVGIVL